MTATAVTTTKTVIVADDTAFVRDRFATALLGAGHTALTVKSAAELLARFGASLDDVVEEVIYVLDVDAAFAVAGPVRKEAYGKDVPQVASTLLGVTRLAFPAQLIEVKLIARVG